MAYGRPEGPLPEWHPAVERVVAKVYADRDKKAEEEWLELSKKLEEKRQQSLVANEAKERLENPQTSLFD